LKPHAQAHGASSIARNGERVRNAPANPELPTAPNEQFHFSRHIHRRARVGKIARLPHPIREQVNRRLLAGETAPQILSWLNSLEAVQTIIAEQFGGREISEANLQEWKGGGFVDFMASLAPREPDDAEPCEPKPAEVFAWVKKEFDFDAQQSRDAARCACLAHVCAEVERLSAFLPLRKIIPSLVSLYRGLTLGNKGSRVFTLRMSRTTLKSALQKWRAIEQKTPAIFARKKGATHNA
jgi:hypothetical protein